MKRVHDQVFEIPPSFVLARVIPTGSELLYGFRHRWVSRGDIGQLAAALASSGIVLSPVEHEIVRATQDDPGRLDELVHETEVAEDYADGRDKVWLFLALAYLLSQGATLPYMTVDRLYGDFGYPPEMEDFVSYMPAQPTQATGPKAQTERLQRFVADRAAQYRARDARRRSFAKAPTSESE